MIKIVSPKAELTVLRGLCSKDKKLVGTLINGIDESYFYSAESVEIYQAIIKHISEEGASPQYRLLLEDPDISEDARSHMRDSQATISTIEEAKKAVRILNKYRQRRGVFELGSNIAAQMKSNKLDMDGLLQKISTDIGSIRANKTTSDSFTHFGKNNNSLQVINDILYGDDKEKTIPTGFSAFDNEAGGFARGSLVTIASTSGGGKSITSSQLAVNMAELGYKVLLVPLEMSTWQMTARIMANVTDFDLTPILRKTLATGERELVEKRMRKWLKKVKKRGGRYSIYKPPQDETIEEIYAAVASFGVDVVIIDYVSLLKGMDGDDMWRALGAAARYGKINAENSDRVNVLVCQLSDDGKIRYSRAITEHSSNSWVWHSDKETKENGGLIKVEQPKSRNSESFPFYLRINYKRMQVRDVKMDDTTAQEEISSSSDKEKADKKRKKEKLPNLAVDI